MVNFQPPFFNFKLDIFMCTLREQKTCCCSVAQSCPTLSNSPTWTAACQASLSTISRSLLKLTSIASVMPSDHLILCRPLLLLPSIFPSIRVFVPCLLPVAKQKTNHLSTNDISHPELLRWLREKLQKMRASMPRLLSEKTTK